MIKVLLTGCNGRMGRAVTELCAGDERLEIVAGVDLNPVRLSGYPVYGDLMEFGGKADVVVDFSNASALDDLLRYGVETGTPLMLATTGYSDQQLCQIQEAAKKIAVFRSGNMSLGISLLQELVKKAASVLGDSFDVEIIEKHHNQKLDAPSGTALMLYEAAAGALNYETEPVYQRQNVRRKRRKGEVGIHSVRGGTIVGEHQVMFAGHHEVVTLSHSALSREVFAAGAVKAALFLAGKDAGLYNMADVVAAAQ